MTILEFLSRLLDLDVRLWVDDGRLRYSAPRGVMTPELRAELVERKKEIIAFLSGGGDAVQLASLPTIVPAPDGRHQPFPLTDVQQAYWIGRSGDFELGNVATHLYLEFEHTNLDLERLELAWQRLIERHDMMRAIMRPDGLQQVLEEVPPYHVEVLDLRGQDPETVAAQLEAVRECMSHQVLPSDQWPLFEIRASRLDGERSRLHVSLDLLIADAWSIQILNRELAQFYEDPETLLPPLEISFRDYVLTESSIRESELYQRSLEYWQSRLPTLPPAPELLLARNPGSLTQPRFVRRLARLEPETWRRLQARATQAGLTPSGVLLAAYAEVLTLWSKNPRFTINLTLFNRLPLHPQVDSIVGDFTSLTLLEVDNSTQEEFDVRARRLQKQLWKDLNHSYASGVRVMRELAQMQGVTPGAAMPIVFTSALVHLTPDQEASAISDLAVSGQRISSLTDLSNNVYGISQTPQVWLDHQVSEQDGVLVFNWDGVEELFPEGLLDDMFETYCCLLRRLADEEDAWQETRQQLVPVPATQLEQWVAVNATQAPISDELLHTLFAAQVKQRPRQEAVVSSTQRLTYEELYRRSNQAGHWLRERGAGPNRLVAVVMEKGWEQVAAVLGVLQSGAAYLPIAADLPEERIWYLLENGEIELALTQSWVDEMLAWPEGIQRLRVDGDEWEGMDEQPLEVVQGPEDLAYVIYTSGSTGQPKGVMIDHRGAVNTILDINERFGVTSEDRVFAISALNFDLSVYDIFGTLATGGTIVIPDASARRDPAHWAALMAQERVTFWDSVPALMEMLVEYVSGRSEQLPDSLRLVMMSGDWIPVTLPDRIRALTEDVEVISLGGATEASIWSILYPIEEVDPAWQSIPYGKPMVNQTFHVLDGALEPRPVWVPGDLYIGGIGLAKGYWQDEEKTETSFITHPRTGERLYRTGDLGRYLPDGNIDFLGREDFQVKIGGHRIELGEIEAALTQHPAVRTGVVSAVGELRGHKRLVAYVVPDRPDQEMASSAGELQDVQEEQPLQMGIGLLDPIERMKFKLTYPGLRQKDGNRPSVQLIQSELDEARMRRYVARRSYRKFEPQVVSLEQLSRLLGCLLQVELDGLPLPKSQYGSAGGLYPIQTYLYVKPDRVERVRGGTYYYHPKQHRLVLLSEEASIDPSLYPPGNRNIFEMSAFAIFLVGQMQAVMPMYGEWARDFCMLEAGLMSQLLETSAPACEIGLCQIGAFDFDSIRHWFMLEESHMYLHSLLGGRITPSQTKLQALVVDSDEVSMFVELARQELATAEESGTVAESLALSVPPLRAQDVQPDGVLIEDLRSFLREKLPEYMVPSAIVLLEALPLTPNGKVDRKALPEPDSVSLTAEKDFVAPRTPVETVLAGICAEILGLDRLGVYDNFFEVGGDSLAATRLVSELREVLQVELPLRALFEVSTIDGLTAALLENPDKRVRVEKTAQLLMELAEFSEEEIEKALNEKRKVRPDNER